MVVVVVGTERWVPSVPIPCPAGPGGREVDEAAVVAVAALDAVVVAVVEAVVEALVGAVVEAGVVVLAAVVVVALVGPGVLVSPAPGKASGGAVPVEAVGGPADVVEPPLLAPELGVAVDVDVVEAPAVCEVTVLLPGPPGPPVGACSADCAPPPSPVVVLVASRELAAWGPPCLEVRAAVVEVGPGPAQVDAGGDEGGTDALVVGTRAGCEPSGPRLVFLPTWCRPGRPVPAGPGLWERWPEEPWRFAPPGPTLAPSPLAPGS